LEQEASSIQSRATLESIEILKNPKVGKRFGEIFHKFEAIGKTIRSWVEQNSEMRSKS